MNHQNPSENPRRKRKWTCQLVCLYTHNKEKGTQRWILWSSSGVKPLNFSNGFSLGRRKECGSITVREEIFLIRDYGVLYALGVVGSRWGIARFQIMCVWIALLIVGSGERSFRGRIAQRWNHFYEICFSLLFYHSLIKIT